MEFSYDELNRKSSIFESPLGDPIADYQYIGPGRVHLRGHGNGTQLEYSYDAARRIVGTTHVFDPVVANVLVDDRSFSWDQSYNKPQRQDTRPGGPGLIHDYVYDSLHRLREVHVVAGDGTSVRDTTYDLDGVGNRLDVIDDE